MLNRIDPMGYGEPMIVDLTGKIERLDALEENLQLSLSGLSAFLECARGEQTTLTVRGEVRTKNGFTIPGTIKVEIAAYDTAGRVVGTDTHYLFEDTFYAFETFEIRVEPSVQELARIRVYPRKS